jgi:ribosomal protein S18 acetylase RimI-like enzyme
MRSDLYMEPMDVNKQHDIDFKHITGQDMIQEIKGLFLEYAQSLKIDLAFQNFEAEFNTLPGKYEPPHGVLILALVDGRGAGCIALRKSSEGICEMKRLYVRDDYRGLGIGKKLITMIIEEARKLKYSYIRLDTLPTMKKAQDLYVEFGFYDIDPYVYNPIKGTRFLELNLKD